MQFAESFRDRIYRVTDPDARIRISRERIFEFAMDGGAPRRIPEGDEVRVREVLVADTGLEDRRIFALVESADGRELGWTSTRNFAGAFENETLGIVAPGPSPSRFGANAAWSRGEYLGQIDLVRIVSSQLKVRHVAASMIDEYMMMVAAAAEQGIAIALNSGFRSYPEQKFFRDGFERGLPGFNLAAKPGFSNHQNGVAFDLDVAGGAGNPTYDWLTRHAPGFGFVRTVNREPWHWEHDPARAATAVANGTFKTPNVSV